MARAARFDHAAKVLLLQWPVSSSRRLGEFGGNFVKFLVHLYKAFRRDSHEMCFVFGGHRLFQDEAVMNLLRQKRHLLIIAGYKRREDFLTGVIDGGHFFTQEFANFWRQLR